MTTTDGSTEAVEQLIRSIIERGSTYDVAALERLYADDLQVVRVGADGAIRVANKEETLRFFRTMRESGSPTLSQMARIRVTEVGQGRAHAVVVREMQMDGMPRRLVFSVDCVHDGTAWRVRREVAVAQP